MRKRKSHMNLALLFSAIVMAILLLTGLLSGTLFFFMIYFNVNFSSWNHNPIVPILMLLLLSAMIGTILSFFASKITLRPIREIIDATKQLSEGNFKTRIHLGGANEFVELTKSFNSMAEELGSIEMLRSDFVNNFSHEFKTPIVSLRGFAKILRSKDLSDEERDEYLDIIISESNRLASLSTSVLYLSKIENQAILTNSTRFNLSEQIRRIILLSEAEWEKKQLTIKVDLEEIEIWGNEDMLSHVWVNLLNNAIKFTPQQGNIDIELTETEDVIIFQLNDTGCGIEQEAIKHIFDKFYQGDTSHTAEGVGLGLSIVQKIVDLHHGELVIDSEKGVGTNVVVRLPKSYV